jgi:hypothetical protein
MTMASAAEISCSQMRHFAGADQADALNDAGEDQHPAEQGDDRGRGEERIE